jgi:serine protease
MAALHPARPARLLPALLALILAFGVGVGDARAAGVGYVPDRVVVGFRPSASSGDRAAIARAAGAVAPSAFAPYSRVLRLPRGATVPAALARLRHQRNVAWAVPDYLAHTSAIIPGPPFVPNDPGLSGTAGGWRDLQWNFVGPFGVNAPQAWANLGAEGAAGGRGVLVAVLDTGVAYRNVGRFRRSPDLGTGQFVRGADFVSPGSLPVDHNGHGTHVASTIAEETNNGVGLTGLAYGAHVMPVRVLDSFGTGDAAVIAQGVRYAVNHGAQVINLSLEFDAGVSARDIPELISALRYAHRRGAVTVAAAGNGGSPTLAYPARAPFVISVGATTEHGCLSDFSDDGPGLTLVAPGGGADADIPGDPNCNPQAPAGRDIYQLTFVGSSPRAFGIPTGYDGTSMACPHVAAAAALVIASGVLGRHPSPTAVEYRLRATARALGGAGDRSRYGAGLIDVAAATAPGGPGAVASARR